MKKHSAPSMETTDREAIRAELASADDAARARAVRQLCPCHSGWDAFEQCLAELKKLQKDPSPPVRAAALHVFEDAFGMDNGGLPTSPQTLTNELAARKRRERWQPLEEPEAPRSCEKAGKPRRRHPARGAAGGWPSKK